MNGTEEGVEVAILGCGSLGTAILQGLLHSQRAVFPFSKGSAFAVDDAGPPLEVTHIYTTVAHKESVPRIQAVLEQFDSPFEKKITSVTVHLGEATAAVVQKAHIIIVAVPHQVIAKVLSYPPVRAALVSDERRRTLISVAGGVSSQELYSSIYGIRTGSEISLARETTDLCTILVAIPNIAAKLCKSMTIVAFAHNLLESNSAREGLKNTLKLFKLLGEVKCVRENQLPRAAAIASASLAFWAQTVEAVAQGASREKKGSAESGYADHLLDEDDAIHIAAHAMRGAGEVLIGENTSPQELIKEVASKGGSTEWGLTVLQGKDTDSAFGDAVRACAGSRVEK